MLSLERPAQRATCVIESLETRQLLAGQSYPYTITKQDNSFHFTEQILSGEVTSAYLLKDSRLVVNASTPIDMFKSQSLILVINPDGSLSKDFNKTGRLTVNTDFFQTFLSKPFNDGSFLHISESYDDKYTMRRVLPSGQIDPKFGNHGKLDISENLNLGSYDRANYYQVRGDQFFVYSVDSAAKTFSVQSYSVRGKWIYKKVIPMQNAPQWVYGEEDGTVHVMSLNQSGEILLSRFSIDGSIDQSFGQSGYANVTQLINQWARKQHWQTAGPDYTYDYKVIDHPLGFVPQFELRSVDNGSANGSIAITLHADGLTRSIGTAENFSNTHVSYLSNTMLSLALDRKGNMLAVHDAVSRWKSSGYEFENSFDSEGGANWYSGSFQIANASVIFDASDGENVYGFIHRQVPDGHGGFYTVGSDSDLLKIIHTLPFSGTMSGRVFADKNHDGVRQVGEKLLANQLVYIDENGNGKQDNDELVTYTDSKGYYRFIGLYKGTYKVRIVPSKNQHVTTPIFSTGLIILKLGQSKWGEIGVSV